MNVIEETVSLCSDTLKSVNAELVEENNKVFLIKENRERVLVDNDAEVYKKLSLGNAHADYGITPNLDILQVHEKIRKKTYSTVIYVTSKCNMKCPICYRNFTHDNEELSLEDIETILINNPSPHISFSGGECTTREELPDMIKLAKKYKRDTWIITNGLKLTNEDYLKTLLDSGLDGVHLSFDGFDENIDNCFRRVGTTAMKLRVLDNLKKYNVTTEIISVIDKEVNPNEVKKIIDYAKKNSFVKALRFMPLYEPTFNTTFSDVMKLVCISTGKSIFYFSMQKKLLHWIEIKKMLHIADFFVFRGFKRPLSIFVCNIGSPLNITLNNSIIFSESKGVPTSKDGKFSLQLMVGNLQ